MVHLKTTKEQKKYLYECGYNYSYLNTLSKQKIYKLYRQKEKQQDIF